MNTIFSHVANGGTVLDLCSTWEVPYSEIMSWVNADEKRKRTYLEALQARDEWERERVLQEVRRLGTVDVRKLFNDDGTPKALSDLDSDTAAAIAGIEVTERFDSDGNPSTQRRVKLVDKLAALKMLGSEVGMFREKVEVSGKLGFEALVTGSWPDPLPAPVPGVIETTVVPAVAAPVAKPQEPALESPPRCAVCRRAAHEGVCKASRAEIYKEGQGKREGQEGHGEGK